MISAFLKRKLTALLAVIALAATALGIMLYTDAGANAHADVNTGFQTVEGASIRLHDDKARLGIRYQIRMESTEYETFMNSGYTDVEFGVFIIPEDYRTSKGDFTVENLFTNPIYWFGDVAEEDKAGKTQIINLSSDAMTVTETVDATTYNVLNAAIITIREQNVTRPFAGVGYVRYTDAGEVKYVLDDNGSDFSRSIAQVADLALKNDTELDAQDTSALNGILSIKPTVNVTAKNYDLDQDGSGIKTNISALSYRIGETLDITDAATAAAPTGMKVDIENSVLSAEIPVVGHASFSVKYVKDFSSAEADGTTGNLVTTLLPNGYASSYLTNSSNGQLFNYGTNNDLYFVCYNPSYANRIVFNSEFVQECFDKGLTDIKVSYYVSSLANGAWVKIGPQRMNGTAYTYFSARESQPWLKTDYTADNPISTTYTLAPYEIAKIDFAGGEKFSIGELAAGSPKTQVIFTDIEFCKPEKAYNLLSDVKLFDETSGVMATGEICETGDCWQQYLDISASDAEKYGYTGKYINLYRHGSDESFIYFKKDFLDAMLNLGYTKLTVVAMGSSSSVKFGLYDYSPENNTWTNATIATSEALSTSELKTFTFDLKDSTITNCLSLNVVNAAGVKLYIYEISFSR